MTTGKSGGNGSGKFPELLRSVGGGTNGIANLAVLIAVAAFLANIDSTVDEVDHDVTKLKNTVDSNAKESKQRGDRNCLAIIGVSKITASVVAVDDELGKPQNKQFRDSLTRELRDIDGICRS